MSKDLKAETTDDVEGLGAAVGNLDLGGGRTDKVLNRRSLADFIAAQGALALEKEPKFAQSCL